MRSSTPKPSADVEHPTATQLVQRAAADIKQALDDKVDATLGDYLAQIDAEYTINTSNLEALASAAKQAMLALDEHMIRLCHELELPAPARPILKLNTWASGMNEVIRRRLLLVDRAVSAMKEIYIASHEQIDTLTRNALETIEQDNGALPRFELAIADVLNHITLPVVPPMLEPTAEWNPARLDIEE